MKKSILQAMLESTKVVFDRRAIHGFRKFLHANADVTNWLLLSDYNLNAKDRPSDVIAFSILPVRSSIIEAVKPVKDNFPADFKNIRRVAQGAKDFFLSQGAAFHVCWMIEKETTVLHRENESRVSVARASAAQTLEYVQSQNAPEWLVKHLKRLKQQSLSNSFSHKMYNHMLILSNCYAFLVELIHRERPTTGKIWWCSDRDALLTWNKDILGGFAFVNACRWATFAKKSLDANDLPQILLAGDDWFDYSIRPPDYLAATLSSWNSATNGASQPSAKYRDMLRDTIAENQQIAIITMAGTEIIQIHELLLQRVDES